MQLVAGVVCSCASSDKSYISSTVAAWEEARLESLFKASFGVEMEKLPRPCASLCNSEVAPSHSSGENVCSAGIVAAAAAPWWPW